MTAWGARLTFNRNRKSASRERHRLFERTGEYRYDHVRRKINFSCFRALAEFERELIKERTHAGLKAARARGKRGGRPNKLTPKQIEMAQTLMNDPNITIDSICQTLKISKPTLYRYCPSPFIDKEK